MCFSEHVSFSVVRALVCGLEYFLFVCVCLCFRVHVCFSVCLVLSFRVFSIFSWMYVMDFPGSIRAANHFDHSVQAPKLWCQRWNYLLNVKRGRIESSPRGDNLKPPPSPPPPPPRSGGRRPSASDDAHPTGGASNDRDRRPFLAGGTVTFR